MLDILGLILTVVVVVFVVGFLHYRWKIKHDPYFRHQIEESVQDVAFERKARELRRVAKDSDNPVIRDLAEKMIGRDDTSR